MAKKKISLFECQHCGEQSTKWLGKCPNCGSWDSFIELNQEQQEVLKTIETNFKKVDSVAGATVRGDGSIGIIIDVKSILENF